MEKERKKVVCVTGASGFIASWLVKLLLHHGYTVKATVRNPDDPHKTKHLVALDGAKERLHLFKADLMEEGSFDSVVDGCEGVFHTASPLVLTPQDPKKGRLSPRLTRVWILRVELLDPAVKGTLNVLASCAKTSTIKRVVITSSMASVSYNRRPLTSDVVVDETWFSDPVFCEQSKLWYILSKILAEEAAYKFAKENGIDLVTLHPGFVIGPFLQTAITPSVEVFLKLIKGGQALPDTAYKFVDVRDVAEAHVKALESPSAEGRYCLVAEVLHHSETMAILQKLYPDLPFPKECEDKEPSIQTYKISKDKAKSLGISFTPLEVTFKDTVDCLKEKGFLNL